METIITIGEITQKSKKIRKIPNAETLANLGFKLISEGVTNQTRYFSGQAVMYRLKKITQKGQDYGKIPPNHQILHDQVNHTLQLLGRNAGLHGIGELIPIYQTNKRPKLRRPFAPLQKRPYNEWKKITLETSFGIKAKKTKTIPEIPIQISDDGKLICLPNTDDEPVIGITGKRGTGKTTSLHYLTDTFYHIQKYWLAVINDRLDQTSTWKKPTRSFIKEIKYFGHEPTPLPCEYHIPNTDTAEPEEHQKRLSINFKELVHNFHALKCNPGWKLSDKGFPALNKLKSKFLEAETEEQIMKILEDAISNAEKHEKATYISMNSIIYDLFHNKIISLDSEHTINRQGESLFMDSLLQNKVPVLCTNDLYSKEYGVAYLKLLMDMLFDWQQKKQKEGVNRPLLVVLDEADDIASTDVNSAAAQSVIRFATQGRQKQIGLLLATQTYKKFPQKIRSNIIYQFTFNTNAEQAKEIARDFDLESSDVDEILNLPKFRFMAITKEKFVTYDLQTGEQGATQKSVGRSLFPLSQHDKPKREVKT